MPAKLNTQSNKNNDGIHRKSCQRLFIAPVCDISMQLATDKGQYVALNFLDHAVQGENGRPRSTGVVAVAVTIAYGPAQICL